MRPDNNQEFLGVDVGDKRVGIARGSSLARLAEPLKTVGSDQAFQEIQALARQHGSAAIVVGLPRGLDGQETPQTQKVRAWAQAATQRLDLPFYWQDEALTSVTAETGGHTSQGTDAAAAAVILQDFLDTPPGQRVRC